MKPTALIAVSDKTGLGYLVEELVRLGWQILATGGTASFIRDLNLPVIPVSEYTKSPEMLGGRVKTLHPLIHGGILYRRGNMEDESEMKAQGMRSIDLVVCNLYPFQETIARDGYTEAEAIEQIDIGGPTMIRAAAKNHEAVGVIVDPTDYKKVIDLLDEGNDMEAFDLSFRRQLAAKAFMHVSTYDAAIFNFMTDKNTVFPDELIITAQLKSKLRYGENPHQKGALYEIRDNRGSVEGVGGYTQHHGLEMSYVNVLDASAAFDCVADLEGPAVVIVKHTNPCVAGMVDSTKDQDSSLSRLYERALINGDYVSAYGGIIAVNRPVDFALAEAIRDVRHPELGSRMLYDIVIAPAYDSDALQHLKKKSKNLRILEAPLGSPQQDFRQVEVRGIKGGLLLQTPDRTPEIEFESVSNKPLTSDMEADLGVAWTLCKHVSSNAVVLVKDRVLVGMGAGQPNRVGSAKIAVDQAKHRTDGAVCATDAFLPFPDTLIVVADAGCVALAHTGGSIRDEDSIVAANERGIVLVTTGYRHFRH